MELLHYPGKGWPRISLVALITGLLGFGIGIFAGLGAYIEEIQSLRRYIWFLPYIFGAIAMVASLVSLAKREPPRFGLMAFGIGAGAAASVVLVQWLLGAIVVLAVLWFLLNSL